MRILRITSIGYEGGGTENGIVLMQPELQKLGCIVKILTTDARPDLPHFSDFEVRAISSYPMLLKFFYRLWYPRAYRAVRNVLQEFAPDLVHVHTLSELSPSVLFALGGYPVVMTVHGAEDFTSGLLHWAFPPSFFKSDAFAIENLNYIGKLHYFYHHTLSRAVYALALRRVRAVIAMSRFMQEELMRDGIASHYIPNATELFAPAPMPTGKELLFVGRLEKVKGVHVLLRALSLVIKKFPDAQLTIAGEGSYRSELEALSGELGIADRVRFVGHTSRERLYVLYKQAHIVVVPSIWPEAFGKVGIEAMSVGRPVIASNVGGISEWLQDGEVGYLAPPEDEAQLAEKIVALFSNPQLLEAMAGQAVAHAQNFSIERHALNVVDLYRRVMDDHERSTNAFSNVDARVS